MFKLNDLSKQQKCMFSKMDSWSDYKKKLVLEGWHGFFRTHIMPNIDEESYKVLYSDEASRPNTPVNYLVGLLIIQQKLHLSDPMLIKAALFDESIQYAVGTLDLENQPISKNMISNFRMKLFDYEMENKKINPDGDYDLFGNTIKKLNELLLEMSSIDKSLKRCDSLMISASCKKLTRMQLIYTINERFVNLLEKKKLPIGEEFKQYLDEDNSVTVLYKNKEKELGGKIKMLLDHSLSLYEGFKDNEEVNTSEEFKHLERLISDQYDKDNNRPKKGKEIKPTSMQTPYDPDATYRYKYDHNVGYVANIVEVIDDKKELVLIEDWDLAPNTKSDIEFMEDMIEKKKKNNPEGHETIIVDAGYFSAELNLEAQETNAKLHPTDMTGKNDIETNVNNLKLNDANEIIECPNGKTPIESKYNEKNKTISADFKKQDCNNCPQRDKCPIIEYTKKNKIITSRKQIALAEVRSERKTEEYKKMSRKRAGIEGIPSVLRNSYAIDKRTTKGKFFLGMKLNSSIMAININRMVKYTNKVSKNSAIFDNFNALISKSIKFLKNVKYYVKFYFAKLQRSRFVG